MCPANKKILHTGKEGYPTIVYNVSCDHAGMAHHVTSGTYGSCNDKSIIRMDTHIGAVRWFTENVLFILFDNSPVTVDTHRTDPLFTETEYSLKVSPTEEISTKGVYSIVDGGYHHWVTTMSASRLITDADFSMLETTRTSAFRNLRKRCSLNRWREQMESVRKDIECFFGRLKVFIFFFYIY
jgi:hypothetical protein